MNENIPFNLQLIITEECNLRCKYCFEIDKGPRLMPIELSKKILSDEIIKDRQYEYLQIDLAGGEPFLYFEYLKEIIDFGISCAQKNEKKVIFFICSNMVLLNDEIWDWLKKNRSWVLLGTSIDGTKEAHDHYRCNSYDSVIAHIPKYKELYPGQGVKMTIGPDTIKSIYEGILNIESLGIPVSANVVYEPVWGDSDQKKYYLIQFAQQLELLIDHYRKNPEIPLPNLLSLPFYLIMHHRDPDHSWCGSGKNMLAYDTDGRKLPCHRYSRFCTKMIYEGHSSEKPKVATPCDKCIFQVTCPNCPGFNWQIYSNSKSQTHYHCEFIKLQILASAKIYFLRNESLINSYLNENDLSIDNLSENSKDEIRKISAVNYVMRNLSLEKILSAM